MDPGIRKTSPASQRLARVQVKMSQRASARLLRPRGIGDSFVDADFARRNFESQGLRSIGPHQPYGVRKSDETALGWRRTGDTVELVACVG